MKKITVFACLLAGLAFAACNGNNKAGKDSAGPTAADSALVDNETDGNDALNAVKEAFEKKDAQSIQTAIAAFQAQYAQWVAEGKVKEAKDYAARLQSYLKEHEELVKSVTEKAPALSTVIESVKSIPIDAAEAANEAAQKAAEAAKTKADDIKEKAKDAVNEKVESGKEEALKKTQEGINKAGETANKTLKELGL